MRLAIATIILATATSTIAIIEHDRKSSGTIIQLIKRSPWMKPDNSVDFDVLHSHVESVDAKILRGLENYERNTGMSHPLAVKGIELQDLKKRAGQVNAAALTSHNGLVWYTTITIGTPPQSFTGMSLFVFMVYVDLTSIGVAIDTGSSDLFLPGPTCSDCENSRWDPASSRTAETKGSTFETRFNDGATASGSLYSDNVTLAGLSADIQTIGAATAYSSKMGSPPDGMLGMAFQSMSSYPASPLFETLVYEGKVTEPVFSIKFTSEGGELYLGGTDGDLYQGDIIYTPVTVVGFWQVNIRLIRGNHQNILGDIAAVIDTGCNLILGGRSQVANLHLSLGGKSVRSDGWYSFPCNKFPTISFYFGGSKTFRIPASILNLGPIETGSPDCFSGIVGPNERAQWNLGAIFLKSIYTVFDYGNQRVGFAIAASH